MWRLGVRGREAERNKRREDGSSSTDLSVPHCECGQEDREGDHKTWREERGDQRKVAGDGDRSSREDKQGYLWSETVKETENHEEWATEGDSGSRREQSEGQGRGSQRVESDSERQDV